MTLKAVKNQLENKVESRKNAQRNGPKNCYLFSAFELKFEMIIRVGEYCTCVGVCAHEQAGNTIIRPVYCIDHFINS